MAKKKETPVLREINDFDGANQVLGEIGRLQIELKKIDGEAESKINTIKDDAAKSGKKYRDKIEILELSLVAFGDNHKKEICANGKRSVDLAFGIIGFRVSTKISVTKDKTILLLKSLFAGKGIRIKESEDKEELAKWSDKDLASIAAKRTTEDTFFSDINEEAVNASLLKAV